MAPVGNISMFRRFFGLVENQPLYLMVGIACGLACYTPIRHLVTAPDIALNREDRDYMNDLAAKPRVMDRAKNYEGGVLGFVASFREWPNVFLPSDKATREHYHYQRWPAPRPFNVPAPVSE